MNVSYKKLIKGMSERNQRLELHEKNDWGNIG